MSVVLALKTGNKVWLATDSQVTRGGEKKLITDPSCFKIWKPKFHNNLIMGGVGALRDLNIISTVDIWFDEKIVNGSREELFDLTFVDVVRDIAPKIHAELKSFDSHNKSAFILAYKDKCFQIDTDGCVVQLTNDGDWTAIGSGDTIAEAAYGVLYDLDMLSTREKIIRSVGQSCEQDLGVNYPILMMNTEDMALEVFDGQDLIVQGEKETMFIPFDKITEYEFDLEKPEVGETSEEVCEQDEV